MKAWRRRLAGGTVGAMKSLPVLVWLLCAAAAVAGECPGDTLAARGRSTLRAMDCARCHGGDYGGSSGPSLRAAVREGSRERFERMVLDGDIVRGMPGHRSQPRVVEDLDAIYEYLRAGGCSGGGPAP